MKVIINSVGSNPAIVADIIKEICDYRGYDFDTIIKKINEGKSKDFCFLPEDRAREWYDRLVLAGATVELDKETFIERLIDIIFTPIGKILEWEIDLYHKSKALGIVLFIFEAIALVVLVIKCWKIIISLVFVLAIVDVYNDKRRHTDEERKETTYMFKQMGKWIAIIVAVAVLINFIADRYNPTAVVRNSYFENFSTDITIGEAFDKGFDRGEWEEYKKDGIQYVRFTGYFVSYKTSDGVEFGNTCQIDFIVDGNTYDIAQVWADGAPAGSLSPLILSGILTSVYERNGLSF